MFLNAVLQAPKGKNTSTPRMFPKFRDPDSLQTKRLPIEKNQLGTPYKENDRVPNSILAIHVWNNNDLQP